MDLIMHVYNVFSVPVILDFDVFIKCRAWFSQSDEVYLEAQIQNITPGPIYMEHVSLEPSPQYICTQLNNAEGKDE